MLSRPKSVDEVAYQDEVVNALKKSIETRNVMNYSFVLSLMQILSYPIYSFMGHLVLVRHLPYWLLEDNYTGKFQ